MDLSEVKHLPKVDHTPAELDEASALLLKAAAIMEQYGLVKNIREEPYGNPAGRHCLLGAIDRAGGHDPFGRDDCKGEAWLEAVRRVSFSIQQRNYDDPAWRCATWNNQSERTEAEIIAKLRAVALGG